MKSGAELSRAAVAVAVLLGAALVSPQAGIAGDYEDAMAIIEAAYGPVGASNSGDPGSVSWLVMDMALEAKQLKAAGSESDATEKATKAAALVPGG